MNLQLLSVGLLPFIVIVAIGIALLRRKPNKPEWHRTVGILLLVLTGASLTIRIAYGGFFAFDRYWWSRGWTQYRSTETLIKRIESAQFISRDEDTRNARRVIHRRIAVDRLNSEQRLRVGSKVLQEFSEHHFSVLYRQDMALVISLAEEGRLTQAQQETFFEELVDVSMTARAKTFVANGIPISIEMSGRMMSEGPQLYCDIEIAPAVVYAEDGRQATPFAWAGARVRPPPLIDGCKNTHTERWDGAIRITEGRQATIDALIPVVEEGSYRAEVTAQVRFSTPGTLARQTPEALYRTTRTLTAESAVYAERPPDLLTLVSNDELLPAIRESVYYGHGWGESPGGRKFTLINVVDAPVDCCFDVVLNCREGERLLGTIVQPRKTTVSWQVVHPPEFSTSGTWILLRPNPDQAPLLAQITKMWNRPFQP